METKPVPGYPGYYARSDGSFIGKSGKVLKQRLSPRGYMYVTFYCGGKNRCLRAHRVIALTFLGDPKGMEVNHKNGDKTDNRVKNLEIVSSRENWRHYVNVLGIKRYGGNHHNAKLSNESRHVIQVLYEKKRKDGWTHKKLAEAFKVGPTCIGCITANKYRF